MARIRSKIVRQNGIVFFKRSRYSNTMKSIQDIELKGKRVLIRCALNVPLDEKGNIADDFRLKESLATLSYAAEQGAKCVLLGHLGRPDPLFEFGNHPAVPPLWSLRKVAEHLSVLLGRQILFFEQPIGREVRDQISLLKEGEIAMLENMRFYKGEEANDENFAKELANLGDIYVNDAFDVNHRAHASVSGVVKFVPVAVAGIQLKKEVDALNRILENPKRKMVVIVGGSKIETKAGFLGAVCKLADTVLMGNLVSKEVEEKPFLVPAEYRDRLVAAIDGYPGESQSFDIGPRTRELFKSHIQGARTIFWSGPLGKVEEEAYRQGSLEIANAIGESGAFSVAGGGDLAGFLERAGLKNKFSHISIGGSALLAYIAGEKLPGIEALGN